MANFSISANINQRAEVVRNALPKVFEQFGWNFESTTPNYYQLKVFSDDIGKHYYLLDEKDFDLLNISESKRAVSKMYGLISRGREKLLNSWSPLSALDKKAKELFGKSNLVGFPEILLFENERSTDLHFTLQSLTNVQVEASLVFLLVKKSLEEEFKWDIHHVKSAQRGYIRKEKTSPQKKTLKEIPAAPPKVPGQLKEYTRELKQHLSQNEIDNCFEAIGKLHEKVGEKGTYIADFPLIQSEHQRLRKNILAGIISYQDAELQRNQINHRMLQLIGLLEEDPAVLQHFSNV